MSKKIKLFGEQIQNLILEKLTSFGTIFKDPIDDNNDIDKILANPIDRKKIQDAVDELKRNGNQGLTKTIEFSNNDKITIAIE
jgi:hypothetical protein